MTEATIPGELRAAFDAYEAAIVANDLDALDAFFAPGGDTLRGDSGGLLVGHDAISGFRALRGGVPPREIADLHYRPLARGGAGAASGDAAAATADALSIDGDVALLVSVSAFRGGGRGLQTQIWQRIDGRWLITAAHVTPRTPALDRTIWRSVGDPFLQGAWEGPLAGLTVAVKDLFAIAGFRIGAGNPTFLEEARPEKVTAPAVADLLSGGASLRGIARTDEFAYSIAGDNVHYGTPPNGAVVGALPGGSSSGPASAVATGHADVGLATDTAGSIRVPASYQGLWGLRTTHDLVPRQGMLPLAQSFDTIGWLTRDGDTLQRVADWCLSYDGSASTESVYGASGDDLPWRFHVPEEILDCADADTREAFSRLLAALAASDDPPSLRAVHTGDVDAAFTAFRTVQGAEAWRNDGEWLRAHPGAVGEAVAERFRAASQITAADEARARADLDPIAAHLAELVDGAVLIFPTVPGPAPLRTADVDAVRAATLRMTAPAAIAGLPAVSVPLLTVAGAPVGVCLVSRAGTDIALVRLARRLAGRVSSGAER
ncbi:Asp-tRNAAsn/Glu-tRNAGln amidotransferase A subunit [Microbacterium sp. ru370.1]|uniref:AtzH-like domain-containing protein n=1 Tax=unclassified Microbacterium TaxID=2609290 RepID=UPI00088761AD|nr:MULTISPECIES: AtzH-like domain-containing protein [unclassified Microbacterium]SDO37659.1 Asp-tRNAAsn/Glu-tRNAGln amidotransferase A subunit [Microbacterium sp. ru370.1]SIT78614.1 Asp-tRNAAsn/Glu-tRNAGln amidotransferase A subunit [Microbacterium sp. RU1D]